MPRIPSLITLATRDRLFGYRINWRSGTPKVDYDHIPEQRRNERHSCGGGDPEERTDLASCEFARQRPRREEIVELLGRQLIELELCSATQQVANFRHP